MTSLNRRHALALGLAAGVPALSAAQASAKTLRIGYQKFNTLNILKGAGQLEAALKPLGWSVSWKEFATGPVLLEALNAGAIDFGHAADTPSVFAQAAGVRAVYLAAEQLAPQLGVPVAVLALATGRRRYTAVPVDAAIVAEQQRIADTFFKLKLIPRAVQVRDAVFTRDTYV